MLRWLVVVLCCGWFIDGVRSVDYYGTSIGSLSTQAHQVSGDAYVVDNERIQLINFNYDGDGPDAFFYVGIRGQHGTQPNAEGMIIPNEMGSSGVLGSYTNAKIVLTLPGDNLVTQLAWMSVWCRNFTVNFGSLEFPQVIDVPSPVNLGPFSQKAHGVKSGDVFAQDKKTFRITDLHYDGNGPDAFFIVGSGTPSASGTKLVDENGSTGRLKAYRGVTIEITLPDMMTVDTIDYISIYCIQYTENFGDVFLNKAVYDVPPYIPPVQMDPMPNCETMDSGTFNVGWEVMSDSIMFEFSGSLDSTNGYMAFGLSGEDTGSIMLGGDVMVVYMDSGIVKLADYTIDAKALCSDGVGVCTDKAKGGEDSLVMHSASVKNGITTTRFVRPLATGDSADKDIRTDQDTYVIWGLGNVNDQQMVTKHKKRLIGDTKINFGRTGATNCDKIDEREEVDVEPWSVNKISGEDTQTFVAVIGQTGGKKGYEGITGQVSWGIAWYINDLLIPEITVKRGETFTFKVKGGNDTSNTARYHPLYITDDSLGGYAGKIDAAAKAEVKLIAGTTTVDSEVYGTDGPYCEYEGSANPEDYDTFAAYKAMLTLDCEPGEPGTFTWTPDKNTPDIVYYQCFTHNYLGWKIFVVDDYNMVDGAGHVIKHGHQSLYIITFVAAIVFKTFFE